MSHLASQSANSLLLSFNILLISYCSIVVNHSFSFFFKSSATLSFFQINLDERGFCNTLSINCRASENSGYFTGICVSEIAVIHLFISCQILSFSLKDTHAISSIDALSSTIFDILLRARFGHSILIFQSTVSKSDADGSSILVARSSLERFALLRFTSSRFLFHSSDFLAYSSCCSFAKFLDLANHSLIPVFISDVLGILFIVLLARLHTGMIDAIPQTFSSWFVSLGFDSCRPAYASPACLTPGIICIHFPRYSSAVQTTGVCIATSHIAQDTAFTGAHIWFRTFSVCVIFPLETSDAELTIFSNHFPTVLVMSCPRVGFF